MRSPPLSDDWVLKRKASENKAFLAADLFSVILPKARYDGFLSRLPPRKKAHKNRRKIPAEIIRLVVEHINSRNASTFSAFFQNIFSAALPFMQKPERGTIQKNCSTLRPAAFIPETLNYPLFFFRIIKTITAAAAPAAKRTIIQTAGFAASPVRGLPDRDWLFD